MSGRCPANFARKFEPDLKGRAHLMGAAFFCDLEIAES
jgi:hypothetical protein